MLTGEMIIGSAVVRGTETKFRAMNPAAGEEIDPGFGGGGRNEVDRACDLAWAAFDSYRETSHNARSKILEAIAAEIMDLGVLESRVGRILVKGFPTGVEVSHAMVHGGPYPATSDGSNTSVGTLAIKRFLRPVCYQDFPQALLNGSLQDGNPDALWRLRDGTAGRA
jgi:hypothetical protein